MTSNSTNPLVNNGYISRDDQITIINAGLRQKEYKFVRQVVLNWLAAYPGDIYFNFLYARALVEEGKSSQALPILEMIEAADPEYAPAYELHHSIQSLSRSIDIQITASYFALTGINLDNSQLPQWSTLYRQSQEALDNEKLEDAELIIHQAVIADPSRVLPAIMHLHLASLMNDGQTLQNLSNLYHSRWIDCLYFNYYLATANMMSGDDTSAVALLHQCVSRDSAAQVAMRVLGENNPYKMLWPDQMQAKFDVSVPNSIAISMGWNQLEANFTGGTPNLSTVVTDTAEIQTAQTDTSIPQILSINNIAQESSQIPSGEIQTDQQPNGQATNTDSIPPNEAGSKEMLMDVRQELDRIATRLQIPGVGQVDRRFPVYVVFTTRKGLENLYGTQTTFLLDELMKQVVESVRKKPGWTSLLFYADDTACTTALGIKPAPYNDAWKLKLAIADLDKALSKKGEMIGALLIVGGPEVVPFHLLPNPTDDADTQVPSDNPYASVDDNYFVPEWPVGRLPGGTNRDAGILMQYLRKMISSHSDQIAPLPWWQRLNILSPLWSSMQRAFPFAKGVMNNRPSFGYTAAVWSQASTEVYRTIGDSQSMLASPPVKTGGLVGSGLFPARLGYFNLHGVPDAAEWYGQPNSEDVQSNPEYPVALTPTDIVGNESTPSVIFSEACYGAYIDHKNEDEAISIKFIAEGTKAFVGSTCVAYGSVTTPLIAADNLAQYFWKNLKDGQSAGEALRNAKIHFAQEMNRKQGYLDSEDQKTLISFLLFGDPLTTISSPKKTPKGIVRMDLGESILTVNESDSETLKENDLPYDVMSQVKSIVEQYLPGVKEAKFSIARQYFNASASDKAHSKDASDARDNHTVVTVSKEYKVTSRLHLHYARMTFDGKGKVIKLAVSR